MSSVLVTNFEKEHLWMYLHALGFEPGPATVASGKIVSHTHLGVNMFDKLNRDAFQIVSYFLFQTLDKSLTKEVFKLCWPPFDQKSDTEFRKHCCEWLKKISAECGSSFPQVVGSLFLSPGGPKFIHLMYHFARFVAIKYIKAHSRNSSVHFTETFNVKPQDMHKCIARCHIARNRFLHILQREDCVIREYQENAQLLVKQVRNLRSECMGQENQIRKMEPYDDQSNIQEKIQKVRSLWASVNETLTFLEKEREVVDVVLSLVNQYTLDGTNVAINIPRLLLDKIEKQMGQLHIGNVYEAGKLNLLTVIQLLNEVLKVVKHERYQADPARLTVDLQFLEKETKLQRERLSDLKRMRCKIKEDLTTIKHFVAAKQGEWHKKWKDFLGVSPFSLVKGSTPAVDLLPPMSPLSFDPASEEVYAKSILLQYPASLPDIPKQHNEEDDCRKAGDIPGTVCGLTNRPASFLLQPVSSSGRNSVRLLEKDMKITPREGNETPSKESPKFEMEDSSSSNTARNTENTAFAGSLPAKNSDPFQKEQDHLVEEVARAVLSDSPEPSKGKELKLEELIDTLVSNPFLTRNQIPRTPENLISEIRSSWRKAVEIEGNRSTELIQMDTEDREISPESSPVLHNQREVSRTSFLSATTVSDSSHWHLPEEKVRSDCLKCVPQKRAVTSHIDGLSAHQSGLLNKKVMYQQGLESTALQNRLLETSQTETLSPAAGNRRVVMGSSEEEYVKIADHSRASYKEPSMHKSMFWDSFQLSSGISSRSSKDIDFGILHETLPEEVGHLSLNSSSSTEANFKLEPDSPMHGGIFPEDVVGERPTTPESDFNLQAICRRYEALKKSLPKKREETDFLNSETLERHKPELSPIPTNMQTNDMLDFLDSWNLHSDYTKPSLRVSLGERKRSLSPLIKFSPVEQRLRTTVTCSFGELLPNLKEEEVLNKSLDANKSPSDLKR